MAGLLELAAYSDHLLSKLNTLVLFVETLHKVVKYSSINLHIPQLIEFQIVKPTPLF